MVAAAVLAPRRALLNPKLHRSNKPGLLPKLSTSLLRTTAMNLPLEIAGKTGRQKLDNRVVSVLVLPRESFQAPRIIFGLIIVRLFG